GPQWRAAEHQDGTRPATGSHNPQAVHHFTWAAEAPKSGAPPSPQGAPMAARIDGLSSASWPASDHRQPNDGIQQIWAAAHSFNGMHQRFRRWPRPAAGDISMAPLEIGPSAASRKPIFIHRASTAAPIRVAARAPASNPPGSRHLPSRLNPSSSSGSVPTPDLAASSLGRRRSNTGQQRSAVLHIEQSRSRSRSCAGSETYATAR
ncbi:hypothetical protein ACLOJK_029671, partial [Asimina triloba]